MNKNLSRSAHTGQRTHILIEIFGWAGVASIFAAYLLVSFDFLEPQHMLYQILNLFGGIGIVLESLTKKNYQPAVLNVIWSIVASIALLKIIFATT